MSQPSPTLEQQILIIDDHQLILGGTLDVLRQHYPQAKILTAQTAQEAWEQVNDSLPDLVVMDLSLPQKPGVTAQVETGIQLLQQLMHQFPRLNLMVQSSYVKALVRIKHDIDAHQGGLTVADKNLSTQEMITRVNWALQGVTHTKDLKTGLEVKPEWLEVLTLAFEAGLQDREIAKRMSIAERTVRHYWTKVQDVLGIYPEDSKKKGQNIRIATEIRAREEGLID